MTDSMRRTAEDNGPVISPEEELSHGQMLSRAVRMAWPAVLESFFVALAGMIDTMMVSSMGSYAVAAVGLTQQPKFIGLCFFFATCVAISALVARRKGEKDQKAANEVLLTALIITFVLCVIISTVMVAAASPIMRLAGSNTDTHAPAVTYFRIIMGGSFFNVFTLAINAAQRGSGNTRIAMTTNLVSSIVNVFFNYALIGGHFGFPALGVTAAAIATVLGTVIAFLMSLLSLFRKNSYVRIPFMIEWKLRPHAYTLRMLAKLSVTMLVENLAMRIGFLTTAMMAARLGTDAFAAHNVGMNFMTLGFSFADGMQVAAVALTGESLGAGLKKRAKEYGMICQHIGLVISICLAVIEFLFGRAMFSLFFREPHLLDMGEIIMRYIMVIVLLQISQVIFGACLRAAGDVKYTLFASLISVALIRSLTTYFLVGTFGLGLHGVWIGILSDQASRFLFMSTRFRQGKWVDLKI